MKKIFYWLLYGFVDLFTLIPLTWTEKLRGFLFLLVFYLFPYRKKLVYKNIRLSFPEKSRKETDEIVKKFYLFFCQSFIESLYSGKFSAAEAKERFKITNPEYANELFDKGKSISLLMAHYGNWEWSTFLAVQLKHMILPIYKPLHNKYLDNRVKNDREKYGVKTVPMEKILRTLIEYDKEKQPVMVYFLADQRPLMAKIQHWTSFLNQDTPVVMGPEKIARKFNHAAVFLKVKVVKRGYYEATLVPLFENTEDLPDFAIIEKYYEELEGMIKDEPCYWLWTHNRWKHKMDDYLKLQARRHNK